MASSIVSLAKYSMKLIEKLLSVIHTYYTSQCEISHHNYLTADECIFLLAHP